MLLIVVYWKVLFVFLMWVRMLNFELKYGFEIWIFLFLNMDLDFGYILICIEKDIKLELIVEGFFYIFFCLFV